jgi:hypothetical protein
MMRTVDIEKKAVMCIMTLPKKRNMKPIKKQPIAIKS